MLELDPAHVQNNEPTVPFWRSEYYDVIPTFDGHPVEYWTDL